ncbi:hypothetical protein D9615_005847 [Tricholomella constricta]|uniref:Uncharacterized protein n=1 Tax=Tricholomella constricta TaxID=117010 RepID=A0A8H5HB66_9AGAR|nr:hypothetical protein D9615_010647 [Tricholomella constricta]KAF5379830.1 hypothetical protein D9615_005847 [Tricholomella constricta]
MRSTRSGATFSPYEIAPIHCAPEFDFAALLQDSVRLECSADHDPGGVHEHPEANPTTPQPLEPVGVLASTVAAPAAVTLPERRNCLGNEPALPEAAAPPSAASRNHAKRRRKREQKVLHDGHAPRAKTYEKYAQPSNPLQTLLNSESLPAAKGAYSALRATQKSGDQKRWSVAELVSKGLRLVEWDGYDDRPLLDSLGSVIAVLVGQPRDESYRRAVDAAYASIAREGATASFNRADAQHKRGSFPAINVGVTHGKGTTSPVTLNNHEHKAMAARLLADASVQRLAAFGSASFQLWAPNLYQYYKEHLDPLWARMPNLQRNFDRSIFPSAAFNFGPNVWTYRHRDLLNCPFGWCAIQALGSFDATQGGHLILWDLGLVVEFPPGALVLIPSATISHSNVPVQEGDSRASFTQYCAGGLFRYVDNGFRTENELKREDVEEYARMCKLKETRWQMGLGLFSKYNDIVKVSSKSIGA